MPDPACSPPLVPFRNGYGLKRYGGVFLLFTLAVSSRLGGQTPIPLGYPKDRPHIDFPSDLTTTVSAETSDAVTFHAYEETASSPQPPPLPMPTYGWNLGNTFESTWGFPQPTQAVFETAADAGFNAVRIPCAWDFNANQSTYQIDPAYMAQVKQAVDWSLAAGMHVVINIHWDGGWLENNIGATVDPVINAKMKSYWTQIATAFTEYDNRLLFAAANEPNAHSPAEMATLMVYYKTFIDAVRGIGDRNAERWLVLQGGGDVAWLNTLPGDPSPNRLMVEYHNYTPYQFTLMTSDLSWGSMFYFWGSAYHYSSNTSRNASWGEEDVIDAELQKLADKYINRGIPVLLGEFQAAGKSFLTGEEQAYNNASRLYWNKYLVDAAQARGISPFYWSTPNSPFEYATGAIVDPEVVSVLTGGDAPPPPNGAPRAATALAATAGDGHVFLTWNAVEEADSYALYRSANSGYQAATPTATGITGNAYTDTGLNQGTTYHYKVVALNGSGRSGFSPEAHATTPGINPDPSQFHFESDTQGWTSNGSQISGIAPSTTQSLAGNQSLAVSFDGASAGAASIEASDVTAPAGTNIAFHVWIPSGSQITQVEPYLQDYHWNWTSSQYSNFTADAWNTITLTVPLTATIPLKRLGLRYTTGDAWTGASYLDSVSWETLAPPFAPSKLAAVGGSGQIALQWSPSDAASDYRIKRSTSRNFGYTTIATTEATSLTDSNLDDNVAFYYIVVAEKASGESLASSPALATTYSSLENWRLQHFGSIENSGDAADDADPDGDGFRNWQEFVSATNPKCSTSFLSIELSLTAENGSFIRFSTSLGRSYRLERSPTLQYASWVVAQDAIEGTGSIIQVIDTDEAGQAVRFYRLVVIP